MTRIPFLIPVALIVFTMASCAPRVPFTQQVRQDYKLTAEEMQSLQFYASRDIVLTRAEKNTSGKDTEDGTLTVTSGKNLEQVVIKKGTPGVVEKVFDNKRVGVSFESGDQKYLVFGAGASGVKGGAYKLMARKWTNNKRGRVSYDNKEYVTGSYADRTYLEFKMRKLQRIRRDQRIAKGRKL